MIEHRNIVNLVASDIAELKLTSDDRVAQNSSAVHDSSVEEIWMAFTVGATLVVLDEDAARLGPDLAPWLRNQRITAFCPTPTLLRSTACEHPETELPELALTYTGGEAVPQDLADRWSGGRRLLNGYGPTECTVTATRTDLRAGEPVSIGRAVPGTKAWVLGEALEEIGDGQWGELCGWALASTATMWAQTLKLIEVASVKASRDTAASSNPDSARGRLTAASITIKELIRLAYGVKDYQIVQGPGWMDSARFDIAAKSTGETGAMDDEKALVRELLADRFSLAIHRETRQMQVYLLVVAKDGPKLAVHNDAAPRTRGGCGRLVGRRVSTDAIATMLSRQVEHEVVNRTGVSGEFDVQFDFTPESGPCLAAADPRWRAVSIYGRAATTRTETGAVQRTGGSSDRRSSGEAHRKLIRGELYVLSDRRRRPDIR